MRKGFLFSGVGAIFLLTASQAVASGDVFTAVADWGSPLTAQCEELCSETASAYYRDLKGENTTINACTIERWADGRTYYWAAIQCEEIAMTPDNTRDSFVGDGRPYDVRYWSRRLIETYRLQRYYQKGGEHAVKWVTWEETQAQKELDYQRYPLYRNSSSFIHPELVGHNIGLVNGQHRLLSWKKKAGSSGPGTSLLFSPNHVVGMAVPCKVYASVMEDPFTGTDFKPATSIVLDGRSCSGTAGDSDGDGIMEYESGQVPRPTLALIKNVGATLAKEIEKQLKCSRPVIDLSKQNHLMSAPGLSDSGCLNLVGSSPGSMERSQGATYRAGDGYSLGLSQPYPMFMKK